MGNESLPFGTWLLHQLDRREWSQADFVRRSGFSRTNVSRWISGQRLPSPDNCFVIARVLGLDPDLVLAKAGHRTRRQVEEQPQSFDDLLRRIGAVHPIEVPIIELEQVASAGKGKGVIQSIEGYEYLPPMHGRRTGLYAIRVEGDCMAPRIEPGDTVIFDTERPPEVGELVVAVDGEEKVLIKHLVEDQSVQYLLPLNGAPIRLTPTMRIVGVVQEIRKRPGQASMRKQGRR